MARATIGALLLAVAGSLGAQEDPFAPVRERLDACVTCHGEGGASSDPQYPILAGQELYYLYVQLKDFASGARASPLMEPVVAGLDKPQMLLLAEFFSKQRWPSRGRDVSDADRALAESAIGSGQCVACHLGGFEGDSRVPRLAGQHPEYLRKTMLDFKTKTRKNSPAKGSLFASFGDPEIEALARYLAALTVQVRGGGSSEVQ